MKNPQYIIQGYKKRSKGGLRRLEWIDLKTRWEKTTKTVIWFASLLVILSILSVII